MYPKHYLDLFPAYPRKEQVFVAMSFNSGFDWKYDDVIAPAIRECDMEPKIVRKSTVSDSILTEILGLISESRLIFADLTGPGNVASPNVLYEVGIAHAVRHPQEVVLFRSDTGPLPFDIAPVRVRNYSPSPKDAKESKAAVVRALTDARLETESVCRAIVEKLASTLDFYQWYLMTLLLSAPEYGRSLHGTMPDAGIAQRSIDRLMDNGLIEISKLAYFAEDLEQTGGQLGYYRLTLLGTQVMIRAVEIGDERLGPRPIHHRARMEILFLIDQTRKRRFPRKESEDEGHSGDDMDECDEVDDE